MFGKNNGMFVIVAAIIALLAIPKSAFAQQGNADLSYNEQTGILTITGNVGEEVLRKHNRYVTVQIFNPEQTDIEEETEESVKKSLYNFYQLTPDDDGNFTFSSKVEEIYGYCLIRVRMADDENCFEKTMFIASEKEYNAARDEINAQTDISGMREAILKYSDLYNFTHNLPDILSEKDTEGEFLNCISEYILSKSRKQPYTDFKSIAADFDAELHMWSVLFEDNAENQIKRLEECASYFGFDEMKAYNGQYIGLMSTEKQDVMQLLKSDNPTNTNEFTKSFFEALLLNKLNSIQNWKDAGTVISANSEIIPEELYTEYTSKSDLHTNIHKAVASEKYKNFDRFIEVFTKAINTSTSVINTSVYSGGSGGGGSVSKSGGQYYPLVKKEDTETENTEKVSYDDLTGFEWASDSIYALSEKMILSGRGNSIFAPQENITRAEFVKMIVMACQSYNSEAKCSFEDVVESDWFYPYVSSAAEIGIANGIDEKSFGAGRFITRQEMAAMCYRAVMLTSNSEFTNTDDVVWNDQTEISDYARSGISALYNEKIIQGTGNNCFEPLRNATRAEAAVLIHKLILFIR